MNSPIHTFLTIVFVAGFLWGIRLMNSPRTAVKGNMLGAFSMLGAVVITLAGQRILNHGALWGAVAAGALIGYGIAVRVSMIQMPQLVALLNGFGGGASAVTAFVVIADTGAKSTASIFTGPLALAVGGATFSGSLIAAGKLSGVIRQKPIIPPGQAALSLLSILAMAVLVALFHYVPTAFFGSIAVAIVLVSLLFGLLLTLRIGGADMPITISLLNSLSGLAASITGFFIENMLLVAAGAIVGSAGLILTRIMCGAMNRPLSDILLGRTTTDKKGGDSPSTAQQQETSPAQFPDTTNDSRNIMERALSSLRQADSVVIVPGYGMALSQAQAEVKRLYDTLLGLGKDIRFAIHPVAGRMPGHMNVLLAEVDIPYEALYEMADINDAFGETDAVVVVGANDVVNPAAKTAQNTPIYGMPVLNVGDAGHVIVCNIDTAPGYSGVDNPLYEQSSTLLLIGDARETVSRLVDEL